jgi:hypothetical protein
MVNHKYNNVAFLINAQEDCGFVACYHVIGASADADGEVTYSLNALGVNGESLKTFTLDEFGIEQGLVHHDYTMFSTKSEALAVAKKANPERVA